ncbi:MAG: hypothetical protein WBI82_03315 [Sphaerochaeta sp.]
MIPFICTHSWKKRAHGRITDENLGATTVISSSRCCKEVAFVLVGVNFWGKKGSHI